MSFKEGVFKAKVGVAGVGLLSEDEMHVLFTEEKNHKLKGKMKKIRVEYSQRALQAATTCKQN